MRLGVILPPPRDDAWSLADTRWALAHFAERMTADGLDVELLEPPGALKPFGDLTGSGRAQRRALQYDGPAIMSGPGRDSLTRALRTGHSLACALGDESFDALLGPLATGFMQPLLMMAKTGEALQHTCTLLWSDDSVAERVAAGAAVGPADLVHDALERQALRLADIVVSAYANDYAPTGPTLTRRLTASSSPGAPRDNTGRVLAFVGPTDTTHGLPTLLDGMDIAEASGGSIPRSLTLVGPWTHRPAGVGRALLGRRAEAWRTAFTVHAAATPDAALPIVARPDVLSLFIGPRAARSSLPERIAALGGAVAFAPDDPHAVAAVILGHGDTEPTALPAQLTSCDLLTAGRNRPPSDAPRLATSVCITHVDRPERLAECIASVHACDPEVEVVVAHSGREAAPAQPGVRQLRLPVGTPQCEARNAAATVARGDALVFLDDDNLLAPGGLQRLTGALQRFDIAVSSLELDQGADAAPVRRVFIGEAAGAGLLFNGYGDANLAVRRDAFESLNGFSNGRGPAFDWAWLAAAEAAGRSIGVLQQPAIRYRQPAENSNDRWQKFDSDGAKRALLKRWNAPNTERLVAALLQDAMSFDVI